MALTEDGNNKAKNNVSKKAKKKKAVSNIKYEQGQNVLTIFGK